MMDILTPKGQETRRQEVRAIDILMRNLRGYYYLETPKDKPAAVDGFIAKDGIIHYVCETKCREMPKETLENEYKNRWLITFDKVMLARQIAQHLCVPMLGLLYLAPDDVLLVQKICEAPEHGPGMFTTSMVIETTKTQRTVNGGVATRTNAYIDMSNAKVFK